MDDHGEPPFGPDWLEEFCQAAVSLLGLVGMVAVVLALLWCMGLL